MKDFWIIPSKIYRKNSNVSKNILFYTKKIEKGILKKYENMRGIENLRRLLKPN